MGSVLRHTLLIMHEGGSDVLPGFRKSIGSLLDQRRYLMETDTSPETLLCHEFHEIVLDQGLMHRGCQGAKATLVHVTCACIYHPS